MKWWWTVYLFIVLGHGSIMGQHGLGMTYAPSKVIKHRKTLLFDVPPRTDEFRLTYTYATDGQHAWQRYWNNPVLALNTIFVNFGNDEVLGHAYAFLPEIHFTLKNWSNLTLKMHFGTGIAYMDRPFDAVTNPSNNAIGSYLNNISSLKFAFHYDLSSRWSTGLSTGIVHFSNGRSSSPNSGINIYGANMSLFYRFDDPSSHQKVDEILTRSTENLPSYRRWIADLQYQYGFTEQTTPGGPKYGVHTLSLAAGYRYSRFMTIISGAEYEYNTSVYEYFKNSFYTEEEARRFSRKTSLFIENEFRYGPVFNRLRIGFYLGWPSVNTNDNYLKVTTGIYLPEVPSIGRPYVAVVLKTHAAVADYLAIMGGFLF